jgi:hypothetical protein
MNKCISCGEITNKHSGITTIKQPEPGDISICFKCAFVGVYEEDLTIRALTAEELEQIQDEFPDTYRLLMATINEVKNRKK